MGWMNKRNEAETSSPYFTLGKTDTTMIVGLGNPGKKYDNTRHNIGFACIEEFASAHNFLGWSVKKELKCKISIGNLNNLRVVLVKPTTYMNLSGEAVALTKNFYKVAPDKIVVVHDELDIAFGHIRLRTGGSSAGHNGVESVTKTIGKDYARVRIGIGPKHPPESNSSDFVLQKFTKEEVSKLKALTNETTSIITDYIFSGKLPAETRRFLL